MLLWYRTGATADMIHNFELSSFKNHKVSVSYLQTLLISVELEGKIFSGWSKKAFPILMHFSRNSGSHDEKSCAPLSIKDSSVTES